MDENKKKSYIIIAICCVAALVIGLFVGKTIVDKRKLAKAEEYLAMKAANASTTDASIEETSIDAATVDASEEASVVTEEVVANEPQVKWIVSKEIIFFIPFMGNQTEHDHEYTVNYTLYDNDSNGLCSESHSIYDFSYLYDGEEIAFEDIAKELDDNYAAGELDNYSSTNTVFEYDSDGNRLKETSTSSFISDEYTSTDTSVGEYEYENGSLIKLTEKGNNGEVYKTTTYEYDDNSNLVKEVSDNQGWGRTTTYEYDENDSLIKETNTDDLRTTTITYEYDNNGNEVKSVYTYESADSDTKSSVHESQNEYDENGNLIKVIQTSDGAFSSCTLYTYEAKAGN